jgi:ParB family chromosome partitioning protein
MVADDKNFDPDPKKRGLGRGLDALFGEDKDDETDSANDIIGDTLKHRTFPVEWLKPCDFQPRRHFDDTAIEELAKSISIHGILQPIVVRPLADEENTYEIIAGERRWRAAQKAQLHEVPVNIQYLDDEAVLEIALIENIQREDLSAIEEADAYQQLIERFDHTQEKLAASLGKSRSYIANILRLLNLPSSVKDLVAKGDLSAGHARALIGLDNAEELAKKIVSDSMSVRGVENMVRQSKSPKKKNVSRETKWSNKGVNTVALEEEVTNRWGMKVTIDAKQNGRGSLKINYTNLDQLDDVLHRLSKR